MFLKKLTPCSWIWFEISTTYIEFITLKQFLKKFSLDLVNIRHKGNTLNGINSLTNNEQFYKYFISGRIFFFILLSSNDYYLYTHINWF